MDECDSLIPEFENSKKIKKIYKYIYIFIYLIIINLYFIFYFFFLDIETLFWKK